MNGHGSSFGPVERFSAKWGRNAKWSGGDGRDFHRVRGLHLNKQGIFPQAR
jgi:hypothetical protein